MVEILLIKLIILTLGASYLLGRFKPEGCLGLGGGSSGGGGTTTSTTTTTQELSPEQKKLIGLTIPAAEQFVANPPQLYPGSAIAPFNPLQEQAQQLTLGAATQFLPQFLDPSFSGQQFLASGAALFPGSNPALQAATQAAIDPLIQNFQTSVLPSIRNEAITAGGYGGSRQGIAEGLASDALLRNVGNTAAGFQNQAYQQGLQAMTQALGLTPQLAGLSFLPATAVGAVGSQLQAQEQRYLSEAAQRYLQEQVLPFTAAQEVASLAFGIPGGTATTTGAGTAPGAAGPSGLDIILGGLGILGAFI